MSQTARHPCILRVSDIMQRHIVSVLDTMTVEDLALLLSSRHISGVPVVNEESRVVGIVSLSDLARHGYGGPSTTQRSPPWDTWQQEEMQQDYMEGFLPLEVDCACVSDIMTPKTVSIRGDAGLDELADVMVENRIHRVIVADGDRVVGIVTTMDVMKALPRLLQTPDPEVDDCGCTGRR